MRKKLMTILGAGTLASSLIFTGTSFAKSTANEVQNGTIRVEKKTDKDFFDQAKLSIEQSMVKALSEVQGTILKAELDNENGFLIYSIEVMKVDKNIMDVKIDAGSGEILFVEENDEDKDREDDESEEDDSDSDQNDHKDDDE